MNKKERARKKSLGAKEILEGEFWSMLECFWSVFGAEH
jgi:hypothetical protein